jgi:tetratricopeptide (TPR) repeat protein
MTLSPEVPAGLVEAALPRVLSSPAFWGSPRLRRFLAHVVRHALAGEEDRLKEYTIGVEVFDRGPRFDPRVDAIVRVEALKLRQKLALYYRTAGATDPIGITLPKGAYRPVFASHDGPPPALLDDPDGLSWQARVLLLQCTPEAITRAQRYLAHAAERWPTRPDLHAALAEATLTAIDMEVVSPAVAVPLLRRAAARALALDPGRADARFYLAFPGVRERDKTPVIAAARAAFEVAPGDAGVRQWVASVLAAEGRFGEMLLHMGEAVRLQPTALYFRTSMAAGLFYSGQDALAHRHLRDVREVAPDDYFVNYCLGQLCALTGRPDEAREAAARAYAISGSTQALCGLGQAEARAGRREAAKSILRALTTVARTRYVAPTGLAAIHLALGRLPRAARELSRGQRQGDWMTGWAPVDPRWTALRGKLPGV